MKQIISKEEIDIIIFDLLKNYNEYLSKAFLNKINKNIVKSIENYYGSVIDYFSQLDIDFIFYGNRIPFNWNKTNLKKQLLKMISEGLEVNYKEMKKQHRGFLKASSNIYGSYENLFDECGLKYVDFKKNKGVTGIQERYWTYERLKKFFLDKFNNNESINPVKIKQENNNVLVATQRYYGSYRNFIESIGICYEDILIDTDTYSNAGRKFENILDDILLELGFKYVKYGHSNWNPDYVLNNHSWMDAKLSEWTVYKSDTIANYEPHCKLLTIVFMRGNTKKDEMITNKTRLISVHKYLKQLPKHRQLHYLEQINKIERELDVYQNTEAC